MQRIWIVLTISALSLSAQAVNDSRDAASKPSGEAVYKQRCAICHDQGGDRVPPRATLQQMPSVSVLRALDFGLMMTVAYSMPHAEREAVATYLGTAAPPPGPAPEAYCRDRAVKVSTGSKFSWNGWSPTLSNARFVSADTAGLTVSQLEHLKLKWAYGFDGDVLAFGQPTVIDGQVFVGSASGVVQALRAETGCIEWTFQANGPVRSAIVAIPEGRRHALLFSDLNGWFYSLEAESGKLLWKKRIEEHDASRLTGGSIVYKGIAYVPVASWEETRSMNPQYACCTFRGSIIALRVRDGEIVWKSYTIPEPPKEVGKNSAGTPRLGPSGAGVWAAPTLDLNRKLLYVSTGDNYSAPATSTSDAIMAMDLATGRIVWTKQLTAGDAYTSACAFKGPNCPEENGPDFDFGSSAILVKSAEGRDLILAGQKSGMVYALDPEKNGEIVWQVRVGKGGAAGGVQWGMASDGQNVYAATSDSAGVRTLTTRTLDPKVGGGLTALRVADGNKVWYAAPPPCGPTPGCSPAQSMAVTAIPGAVFSGSLDGHLRAFSPEDGHVLWDFDTVRDYKTVNGVRAKGGSLDGAGPVIVKGMVFVNSGYSRFGGMPGNVLLAFAPEE
jgi:polyvinyl alcohol dehydrogenase (cytochrome)